MCDNLEFLHGPFSLPISITARVPSADGPCRCRNAGRAPWFRPRLTAAGPLFEEIAPPAGIVWKHDNAMSPNRYLPETMGPGVAFFDFDNDGWLDIFMVNSGASDFFSRRHR